jgi:hypothetical protein
MALQGTGSAVNGWRRPLYLTGANYPITLAAWVKIPASSTTSTGLWGLAGSNAMAYQIFYGSDIGGANEWWFDIYDDVAVESACKSGAYTSDGNWHHIAAQITTNTVPPPGGQGGYMWVDGVRVGDTSAGLPIGAQTFQWLQIGVAPTDGTEPVFTTSSALAELCVFRTGLAPETMDRTIAALAKGVNPLKAPGRNRLIAYHPLRRDFRDYASQRTGFAPLGTPVEPVWVAHPPVDPPPIAFRRLPATHVSAALVGTSANTDSGTGALSTAIIAVGTGASSDSATGSLLASSLQGTTNGSRNSATGSLVAATHLVGTGTSSDVGLGAFSGTAIVVTASGSSANSAIGSLTIPSVAANAIQFQNALVDGLIRGQPFLPPTTWYVALVTQLGDTIASGIEVSAGGYARASIPATLSAWAGTQGQGSTAVSTGLTGLSSNNIAITFPSASADWGTVVGYEFWDAPSGGNRWFSGKLGAAVTVLNGQTRQFPIASLSVAIG